MKKKMVEADMEMPATMDKIFEKNSSFHVK